MKRKKKSAESNPRYIIEDLSVSQEFIETLAAECLSKAVKAHNRKYKTTIAIR